MVESTTPTKTSPFYRRSFDAAGVHPDDIKSLDDLAKLPFTTKIDLRDNYPFGMFAVPREQVSRVARLLGNHGPSTRWWATPVTTWTCGPPWWPAACAPPAAAVATCSATPMATACSPAASEHTRARKSWAAPWCRCQAA